MKNKIVACVVLNYNDYSTTSQFINNVKSYNSIDFIIIVDNCSSDDSYEKLKKLSSTKIRVIQTQKNQGYAAGNNVGIDYILTNLPEVSHVIISNPDIYISECGLEKLIKSLDNGYDMVTGLIYNYNPTSSQKYLSSNFAWRVPSFVDMLTHRFLFMYKFRQKFLHNSIYFSMDDLKDNAVLDVECVPGCFFIISLEALLAVNRFDERTFLYMEETILGKKLKDISRRVGIINNVEILHEGGISIKKEFSKSKKTAQILLNSEQVFLKYYLNKGFFSISIYQLIFWISFVEREIYSKYIFSYRKRH